MKILKTILKLIAVGFAVLLLYAGWIKYRSLDVHDGGPPLAVRWEGFYHDMNLRDIGSSINSCLGEPVFRENVALRSAGWFSGWDCDKVGNPAVIYSLNYSPAKEERFFCQSGDEKRIGRYYNTDIQLDDLEFIKTWSNQRMKSATCLFLKDIFNSILEQRKLLLQCDAGRDRTGAVTALLVAMAAEADNRLDQRMLDAIECDYRKSKSLVPGKYGRMKRFIETLQKQGGVASFIEQSCNVSSKIIPMVAAKMVLHQSAN